jgi:Domain of unknown function (DUF4365)
MRPRGWRKAKQQAQLWSLDQRATSRKLSLERDGIPLRRCGGRAEHVRLLGVKRPDQHIIDERAQRLLGRLLPAEWIVRPLPKDYGVDFEIEIVDQHVVSGNRVWVQLKGRASVLKQRELSEPHPFWPDRPAPQRYVSYSTPTRLLDYALRCGFPMLLSVADLQAESIFWLPLRDEIETNFDHRRPAWRDQGTATLRIPIENSLSHDAEQDWPGLRHYALEPTRQVAFGVMHAIHHQLRYAVNFSPFLQVFSDQVHVNRPDILLMALDFAELGLKRVLALDVVFGDAGVGPPSIAQQMRAAIDLCQELRVRVPGASISPMEVGVKVGDISLGIEMISTTIATYEQNRYRWVTFEEGVSRVTGDLGE